MQTPTPPAAAGQPAQHAPLVQPAAACTTGGTAATLSVDLKGWPEGLVTMQEWLDLGGPLDAPDALPIGGAWSHRWTGGCILGGSVQRAGWLS